MKNAFWLLLERKSYGRITVSDIVRDSGVNRSAFYYHYERISELAEDAIADICDSQSVTRIFQQITRDPADMETTQFSDFLSDPDYLMRVHRIALIAGPHGSAAIVRQLKDYMISVWIALLHIDGEGLRVDQKLTLEFAASGMVGIIGNVPKILQAEGTQWIKNSPLPQTLAMLLHSVQQQ
jgi:AcrR family transcriptional regulator